MSAPQSAKTSRRRAASAPAYPSKSAWARALLIEGKTITEITRIIPHFGYAFAYGVAKRTINESTGRPYAETAADRRRVRAVTTLDGGIVAVVTTVGVIKVHPDGRVEMPRSRRSKTAAAAE